MNEAQTDLQKQMLELRHHEWLRRRKAIETITHVHQRPDLATVDILIEIAQQLMRLGESYELVNAVAPRRVAAAEDRGELQMVLNKPKLMENAKKRARRKG